MKSTLRNIERLTKVVDRAINHRDSTLDYDRTIEAITKLANLINDYEGDVEGDSHELWSLNEFGLTPDAILVGAYWHHVEWQGGQNCPVYAMGCAVGNVYSPGPESSPEKEASEYDAYYGLALKTGKVEEREMEDGTYELFWKESDQPLNDE